MTLGLFAFLFAAAAAGWLLWRMARGSIAGGGGRNVTILKGVIFLGLTAVLFAAKLWPLAFMTLFAAAALTGIELWRERAIRADEADAVKQTAAIAPRTAMDSDEAASILGVAPDADIEAVKAAHKKLISQLHPDKGGTDYLAAKINDARDVLLREREP